MLNINKMTSGQESYYRELAREDYYLEGGEPPGQWVGEGASKLALFGQVKPELLSELFRGELDGRKLVQNAGTKKRTPGWDCTFSPPQDRQCGMEPGRRSSGEGNQKRPSGGR